MEDKRMQMLDDHETRLTHVEKGMEDMQRDMASMQASQSRLETAVLDEGRKTRETLDNMINKMFDRDNHIRESKTDVKMKWIGVIGSCLGSGGLVSILYLIFS